MSWGGEETKRDCNIVTSELQYRSCDPGILLVTGATGRRNVYRFHTKGDTYILDNLLHVGLQIYEGIICA